MAGHIRFMESLKSIQGQIEILFGLFFPKRGGTYFYCTHKEKRVHETIFCTYRTKIHPDGLAKYRRHHRKYHSNLHRLPRCNGGGGR
jgi:hypothetical protein